MVRNLKLIKKAKAFKKKQFSIICQKEKLIRAHCKYANFACLCRGFEFYEVKKNVIIFQKENGNTFTHFNIFIAKSLQKEQNSTNLLL